MGRGLNNTLLIVLIEPRCEGEQVWAVLPPPVVKLEGVAFTGAAVEPALLTSPPSPSMMVAAGAGAKWFCLSCPVIFTTLSCSFEDSFPSSDP